MRRLAVRTVPGAASTIADRAVPSGVSRALARRFALGRFLARSVTRSAASAVSVIGISGVWHPSADPSAGLHGDHRKRGAKLVASTTRFVHGLASVEVDGQGRRVPFGNGEFGIDSEPATLALGSEGERLLDPISNHGSFLQHQADPAVVPGRQLTDAHRLGDAVL